MKNKLNNIRTGFLTGILGEGIGILMVFFWYRVQTGTATWNWFYRTLVESTDIRAKVMMFAMVFNAFLFYIIMKRNLDRMAYGIAGASLMLTLYIVIIYLF